MGFARAATKSATATTVEPAASSNQLGILLPNLTAIIASLSGGKDGNFRQSLQEVFHRPSATPE
jgi:hypothetical protein